MLFLALSDQLFWRHCHSLTDHAENLDYIHITQPQSNPEDLWPFLRVAMFSLMMFIWSFGRRMWSYIVLTCDRSSARNIIVLCVFSYNYDNYDKRIARTFVMSFMSQNWGTRFFPAQPAHARWAGNKQNNSLHTSYRWVWLGYVHPKNCINWYVHKRSILTKVMEKNYVGRK